MWKLHHFLTFVIFLFTHVTPPKHLTWIGFLLALTLMQEMNDNSTMTEFVYAFHGVGIDIISIISSWLKCKGSWDNTIFFFIMFPLKPIRSTPSEKHVKELHFQLICTPFPHPLVMFSSFACNSTHFIHYSKHSLAKNCLYTHRSHHLVTYRRVKKKSSSRILLPQSGQ